MRCTLGLDENWELVVGYAARTLEPKTQASFEQHLKSCQACSESVAVQQAVWNAMDDLPVVAVSPDFNRRLHARIAIQQEAGWRQKLLEMSWGRPWRAAVPVAAACVALGVAVWLNHPQQVEVATPAATASIEQALPQQTSALQISPPQALPQKHAPQMDTLEHALDDMDMLGQLSAGTPPGKAGSASPI